MSPRYPTARGIPYDEVPPLPPGWVRVADHRERWEVLRLQAYGEAKRLADRLVTCWGAQRVWLYGSVAGVWVFTEWSDIDLAVEGLSAQDHFAAWDDLERAGTLPLRVDLRRREDWAEDRWTGLVPAPVPLREARP